MAFLEIKTATAAASGVFAVGMRLANGLFNTVRGRQAVRMLWDGGAAAMAIFTGTSVDEADAEHELPDISDELSAIEGKLASIGKVTITITLEPRPPAATPKSLPEGD